MRLITIWVAALMMLLSPRSAYAGPSLGARVVKVAKAPVVMMLQTNKNAASSSNRRGCCSLRRILIGTAIGATAGALIASTCDAGDCTSTYVKYMIVAGAAGGVAGATFQPEMTQRLPTLAGSVPPFK